MITLRLLRKIYLAVVSLYPPAFREQFSAEMETVFSQAVGEQAARGPAALAIFLLSEFSSLPPNLIREHLAPHKETSPGRRRPPASRPVPTAAWSALGYGSGFLFMGLGWFLLTQTRLMQALPPLALSILWTLTVGLGGGIGAAFLAKSLGGGQMGKMALANGLAFALSVPLTHLLQSPGLSSWLTRLTQENMLLGFGAFNLVAAGALGGALIGLILRDGRKALLLASIGAIAFFVGFSAIGLEAALVSGLVHAIGGADRIYDPPSLVVVIYAVLILGSAGGIGGALFGLITAESEKWPARLANT